jgi:curved DNA-binding protein CbpA
MSSRTHYDVLEVAPTAAADEIKRAFRAQIARYHPDKVQHLGKEFQEMAAGRATDLTEAYRVLSNELQRAEYDRSLVAMPHAATMSPGSPGSPAPPAAAASPSTVPPPSPAGPAEPLSGQYAKERASRDQFVRKATFNRIRQALALVGSDYEDMEVPGFDIALAPKRKMFGSGNRPRLLGQFIDVVDAAAVAEAWALAVKSIPSPKDEICVLLLGSSLAPARELADAIGMQRRRNRTAKLTIIPVDVRTWDAHIPVDSPGVCKDLLTRLKGGN